MRGVAALALTTPVLVASCLQPGTLDDEAKYKLEKPEASVDPTPDGSPASDSGTPPGPDTSTPSDSGTPPPRDSGGGVQDTGARDQMNPTGGTVSFEAESGMLNAPMASADDAAAAGGKYISVPTGPAINAMPDMSTMGTATYMFNVSAAGTFTVWGRVRVTIAEDDSFWVKVDQSAWSQWNNLSANMNTDWQWDDVHDSQMPANGAKTPYMLTQGMHTLTVAYREAGGRLDKFVVTSVPNFTPSGMGP